MHMNNTMCRIFSCLHLNIKIWTWLHQQHFTHLHQYSAEKNGFGV